MLLSSQSLFFWLKIEIFISCVVKELIMQIYTGRSNLRNPFFSARVEFLAEAECDEQMRKIWEAGWIFLDPHRIFGNGNNLKLTWAHTLGGFSLYARSSTG